MSITRTVNNVSFSIPSKNETGWGTTLTSYLTALSDYCLKTDGGTRTLLAELDLGATYGIKQAYLKSQGTNPSTTGVVRLANAESVAWRNAANGADLPLKVNASNVLEFNSNPILTLALGTAEYPLKMNAAGTAYEFAQLKNAGVAADAAIAYSKLNLATSIVNADIGAAAAIALSKLATVTGSRALQSTAGGVIEASSVTSTELGYVSGVTSAIQTQLDAKAPSLSPVLTTPQINDTSSDHQYIFAVSELAADRTVTLPLLTGNDEFVFKDHAATLANKTLTSPVLTTPQINDSSADHQYVFAVSELAADRTVTLPLLTGADEFVFKDHAVTLTNKTLTSPVLTTPQINDTSADHQYIFAVSELAADRTVTLPLLTGNDEFVFAAHSATLTNKTIDADSNTITNIENADIKAAAAIAVNKLAAVTASRALASDASGFIVASAVTSTELGYVSGVTSAIQTQLDALNKLTTKGDILVHTGAAYARMAVGTDGQVLTADSAQTNGLTWSTPMSNPMDGEGQLIVGGVAGAPTKLAHPGAANRVLKSTSTTALGFAQIVNADVASGALIAYSKLNLSGGVVNADVNTSAAIARSKLASGTADHVVINSGTGAFSSEATLSPVRGGTGVANNAAATLTRTGNHALTLTTSNTTDVTLPTTGTLATLDGSEIFTNKSLTAPTITSGATLRGDLLLQNSAGAQPTLQLSEDPDNGTNKVIIQAPATLGADYTLTLPTDDGGANQVLTTDGFGALSWSTVATTVTTTRGDLIKRGAAAEERLAIGTADQILKTDGTDPSWGKIVNANVDAAAAIAYSKLNLATSIVNADVGAAAAIAGTKISPNFGSQNVSTTGTVSGSSYVGNNGSGAVAAGSIGEKLTFTQRSTTSTAGSVAADSSALVTLTAGTWLLFWDAYYLVSAATNDLLTFYLATNGNANSTGIFATHTGHKVATTSTTSAGIQWTCTPAYYQTSGSQAIYFKTLTEDTTSLSITCTGYAVRIA